MKTSIDVAMDAIERYILPLMEDFRQYGCSASPMFKLWDMFRNAIKIMLQNIRSEREGIWKLNLSSVSAMLSLIFVTNRVNHSRWFPAHPLDMFNLPPEVVSKFESGNFAIRQKPGAFNGIWSDMVT